MKFSVSRLLGLPSLAFLVFTAVLAQSPSTSSCECIECPPDEIAVCHYDSGQCKGKCVRIKSRLSPKDFTAELLTVVLGRSISSDDLSRAPKEYSRLIDALVESNGHQIRIAFRGESIRVGVGLNDSAKDHMRIASAELKSRRDSGGAN